MLWAIFLGFPLPWIAILTGQFTAEVGRQPWTVYGVSRTADAMTPFLTMREAAISLVVFCAVYSSIFSFGVYYIYKLPRAGPAGRLVEPPDGAVPNRPDDMGQLARAGTHRASRQRSDSSAGSVPGFHCRGVEIVWRSVNDHGTPED
jgi:hypothetical protein